MDYIKKEEIEILEQDLKDKTESYEKELEDLFRLVGWIQKDKLEIDIIKNKLEKIQNENN